jgi:chromosome segregation ATPase
MNETQINAMFQSLQQQNQQLSGQLAEAHGQLAVLQKELEELKQPKPKEGELVDPILD